MTEESLSDVFWRLLGEGLDCVEIGHHPEYCAAYQREVEAGKIYSPFNREERSE